MKRISYSALAVLLVIGAAGCAPMPSAPTVTVDTGEAEVAIVGPIGSALEAGVSESGALPATPADVVFPFGALSVKVSGLPVGGAANIILTFPSPVDSVRKLVEGVWDPFIPDATTGATVAADGRSVTLTLLDGGRGDSDGIANGTIVDPVAPAVTPLIGQCLDSSFATSEPGAGFSEPGVADLRLTAPLNTVGNASFFASIDGSCAGFPIPVRYTAITAADIPSAINRCTSLGRNPYGTLFGYGRSDWYLCS